MKTFKKLSILLIFGANLCLANTNSFYEVNHISFKEGFEAGLKALEFQAQRDGFKAQRILVSKPFLLVYEIKNTPLNEALFLQIIADKEGFDTHLSKDFLSFGSFNREIDAKSKAEELLSKFKLDKKSLKILKNEMSFSTYPFLWQDFHNTLLNDAISAGVLVEEKIVYKTIHKNPTKEVEAKAKPKIVSKKIVFKNAKAMAYQSLGGAENDSLNFSETKLLNKKEFEFEKEITTTQGEKFVKVKGENLYFSALDTEIKE